MVNSEALRGLLSLACYLTLFFAKTEGFVVHPIGSTLYRKSTAHFAVARRELPSNHGHRKNSGSKMDVLHMALPKDSSNEHKDKSDQRERREGNDAENDALMDVKRRDWRTFRKNLISRYSEGTAKDKWTSACWAHEIGRVEPGCLLLASEGISEGPFKQTVILILSHDDGVGTVGLIINRPGIQRLRALAGLKPDLAEVFADSKVFDGGPVGLGTMTVVHAAEDAEGSEAVLPGVFAGGFDSLVQMARQGNVEKERVRFVHGHAAWAPFQLQGELNRKQWFVASAAPELVTARCDEMSSPLWGRVLSLMGGRYAEVARRNKPSS